MRSPWRDSVANPFVANAGGNLYIQGNQGIDIWALNHLSQTPFVSGGNLTLVSDGIISTDAHFRSGNNMLILDRSGKPANFTSLYDPIFTQPNDYISGGYGGASLKIDTTSGKGNITFNGDISISSPDAAFANASPGTDEFILATWPSIILRSGGNIQVRQISMSVVPRNGRRIIMQATGNIQAGIISVYSLAGDAGYISLSAGGNISTEGLRAENISGNGVGGDITVNAGGSFTIIAANTVGAENITTFAPNGGGNITIKAKNDISIGCATSYWSCLETVSKDNGVIKANGNSGNVSIISEQGSIIFENPRSIDTSNTASVGSPGAVNLQARGDITVGQILTKSEDPSKSDGANINITSVNGTINTGQIDATSNSGNRGGNIKISTTNGDIKTGNVSNYGTLRGGQGGIINFTSTNGSITTGDLISSSTLQSGADIFRPENGGSITLNAGSNITTGNLSALASLDGGPIALTSGGTIDVGAMDVRGDRTAGKVTLQADSGIKTSTVGITITGVSENGNGSNVTLSTTKGDINIGEVVVGGKLQGGNLEFTNKNGNITTSMLSTSFNSSSPDFTTKKGGTVNLNATGNITTSDIEASGIQDGGSITFKSGGSIDTTAGIINAMGGNNGGNISLEATNNINTAGIGKSAVLLSGVNANSGNFRIQSGGNINTTAGPIITAAANGKGGGVTINAGGTVSISDINSRTFAPSITVTGGTIDVQAKDSITASGEIATNRNNITFNAPVTLGNDLSVKILETGDITFKSTVDGPYSLTVKPDAGIVQLGGAVGSVSRLNSVNIQDDIPESSGAINILTTNNITAKNITSTAGISLDSEKGKITTGNLDATSPNNGGKIELRAGTNILAGDINTSSAAGNGGSILLDATGSITVNQINAQSQGSDIGGNVEIQMGKFFRSLRTEK